MRDHDDNVLLAATKHSQGFGGATVEEARACLFGLQSAYAHGSRRIIIKSDRLQLIQMLRSQSILDNLVSLFVKDIISFVEHFDFRSWSFVKRGGNRVARDLTHRQSICLEGRLWTFDILGEVLSRASGDMYAYISNNLI